MKKALISRYGAYGDIIHCSHLPRLLKEQGFDIVDFETNHKGTQILCDNPFIDNLLYFEPANHTEIMQTPNLLSKHWDVISEGYDKFVNLYHSLEHAIIAMESDPEYYMHESAREEYRNINFYDQTTKWAGYPELVGKYRGEVWYTDKEYDLVEKDMAKYKNKFVVMLNLSGTTIHKRFVIAPQVIDYIVNKYKDAYIILTGDETCKEIKIEGKNIRSIAGKKPFRQALLMARYVDLLISMESGIAVGANAWGTPTIQLMTSSSLVNHPNYCKGDFSIQSPARCSPCTKGPYRFIGCPHKDGYPLCVYFDVDEVTKKVDEVYEAYTNKRFPVKDRLSTKNATGVSPMRDEPCYSGSGHSIQS